MIELAKAQGMAEKIVAAMAPYCERIAVAGSIRRLRPMVGDIDIVVLPKPDQLRAFRLRCKQNATVVSDGDQNLILTLKSGVQLDIWIASHAEKELLDTRPCNFGSLLLCRTGSIKHNIHLVQHAKSVGLVWNPYWGVFAPHGRRALASETEEDIFKALKLDFVPPERRER